jgi:hypothetical protein
LFPLRFKGLISHLASIEQCITVVKKQREKTLSGLPRPSAIFKWSGKHCCRQWGPDSGPSRLHDWTGVLDKGAEVGS